MINNSKVYDLVNNQFRNPFHFCVPSELKKLPLILLGEEDETEGRSNLMYDLSLFKLKIQFTPNAIFKQEGNYIDLVLQATPSELQIIRSESQKKKYIVNYTPALVYRFKIFRRSHLKTVPKAIPSIKSLDHHKLVDLGNLEIIDIYDKVNFKDFSKIELDEFRKMLRKHEQQFKHLFINKDLYPVYNINKESGEVEIVFPDKSKFSWVIHNEGEEKDGKVHIKPQFV